MKRDGALKSIWQEAIPDYQPVNNWNKDDIYDVLIVGGGITGLTTALLLQSEGKKCILAEAHNIGFGTTGGTTAHLNTILDTSYHQVEKDFGADNAKLLAHGTREAIDLIEGLVNKYNIDCDFSYHAGYLFAQNEQEVKLLESMKEAADRAGAVNNWTEDIPIPMPFEKACRFEFQAQLHPTKYLNGLAKAFEQEGGVLLQQCKVDSVELNQHFKAETSLGTIAAQHVVYATHIPPGLNILHMRCAPYRSYAVAFRLKSGTYPNGLVYDLKEPYNYFRTQTIEGKEYIIAGGFDHKTGHETNTQYIFTELEAYLRKHFDIDTIDYKWSAQYYVPADGLPYIGLIPGEDRIYTATGFNGNGMVLGSLGAKVLCGLICTQQSIFEQLFNPNRIKPIAGFKNFVKENADVVGMYISKRFSYDEINALVELAPGDAAITEWEGKKVAIYKEENGKIHVLNPVCPHAGCIVAWNNAEKSWDCPCHGARYAPNGDLLTGPATHGLTQIKTESIDGD